MLVSKNRTLYALSDEQKVEICRYKRDNPNIPNISSIQLTCMISMNI